MHVHRFIEELAMSNIGKGSSGQCLYDNLQMKKTSGRRARRQAHVEALIQAPGLLESFSR
jgi:hypothetical protein